MDPVAKDFGPLSVGCQCGVLVKEESQVVFLSQIEGVPSFVLAIIDLIHDFLYLGWGDFLQELAAYHEPFITINEIGLGIVLLDGVLGQDGEVK